MPSFDTACPATALPKLSEMLGPPRLVVLGDFGFYAEALNNKTAQDFMGLLQMISGPVYQGGHILDVMFCSE